MFVLSVARSRYNEPAEEEGSSARLEWMIRSAAAMEGHISRVGVSRRSCFPIVCSYFGKSAGRLHSKAGKHAMERVTSAVIQRK